MWQEILTFLLPSITALLGWLVGRRKQNNDFLHELQKTINMLVEENSKLLMEQIVIKKQNAQLLCEMEAFRIENGKLLREVEQLRIENNELQKQVADLSAKLENVKTITRTK